MPKNFKEAGLTCLMLGSLATAALTPVAFGVLYRFSPPPPLAIRGEPKLNGQGETVHQAINAIRSYQPGTLAEQAIKQTQEFLPIRIVITPPH